VEEWVDKESSAHLQNVVVLRTLSNSNLFRDRQHIRQVLVRDLVQLLSMIYNNIERPKKRPLRTLTSRGDKVETGHLGMIRAWPLDRGLISKKE
jgi:hypothetical protein